MEHIYRKTDAAVAREIAGETLLVPVTDHLPDLENIYALDDISAFVWGLLDGKRSLQDMVDALVADFDVTEAVAKDDVAKFLAELHDRGLVEPV